MSYCNYRSDAGILLSVGHWSASLERCRNVRPAALTLVGIVVVVFATLSMVVLVMAIVMMAGLVEVTLMIPFLEGSLW